MPLQPTGTAATSPVEFDSQGKQGRAHEDYGFKNINNTAKYFMNLKDKLLVYFLQNCVYGKRVKDQQKFRVDNNDAGPSKPGSSKTNQLQ